MARKKPTGDFVPTMVSFIEWYFRTLDPEFTGSLLGGRSIEEGSAELFRNIAGPVRGNRGDDVHIYADDYGLIMDSIAALHLCTRCGKKAVRLPDKC